jgi:hypothetical protein
MKYNSIRFLTFAFQKVYVPETFFSYTPLTPNEMQLSYIIT